MRFRAFGCVPACVCMFLGTCTWVKICVYIYVYTHSHSHKWQCKGLGGECPHKDRQMRVCEVSLHSHEWEPVIHLVWDLTSPCYFAAVSWPIRHLTPPKIKLVSMNFFILWVPSNYFVCSRKSKAWSHMQDVSRPFIHLKGRSDSKWRHVVNLSALKIKKSGHCEEHLLLTRVYSGFLIWQCSTYI